ncbi:putative endo- -beta- protein [Eutypa lata UCREL1]|uniref:Putative endo--beta-protein n=1 Tax=Eutypa lata (strain UCR-EL1) TaxID=1287681 RepID=M7SVU3_EUTLA|nr:putative endo- -beta- protein [Eutypa lata UCREL1]
MPYSLTTHYAGSSLLDGFSFFTGADPNGGFVNYQNRADAETEGLVSIDEFNRVRLGVDSRNTYSTTDEGRPSVRLTSDKAFDHGLVIADFYHMPASTCGTWPAFWAFDNEDGGANYPAGGEVDIIEGANAAERNLISAHTLVVGLRTDMDAKPDNIGCNYAAPASDTTSYGNAFNAEGGGVYALEWDDEELKIWHFPRSAIPDDIVYAGIVSPNPETWGPPQAVFGGSDCDANTYFYNLSLVINTNFCGDYAGNTWGDFEECTAQAPTCEEFVAGNPDSFLGSYWDINYIDVYVVSPNVGPLFPNTTIPIFPNTTFPNTTFPNTTFPNTTASSSILFPNATSSATTSGGLPTSLDPTEAPSRTRTVTLATVSATSPPPEPTQSDGSSTNPGNIDGYTLLGCFGSRGGFQPFTQVAFLPNMDNEVCVSSCAGFKYAGVYDETCYCAGNLGDATPVDIDECDIPCPGNQFEFCGGLVDGDETGLPGVGGNSTTNGTLPIGSGSGTNSTLAMRYHQRRAAPNNILLTVYGDLTEEPLPAPAPGMGTGGGSGGSGTGDDGEGDEDATTTATADATTTLTRVVTTAITVTYEDVCPTDAARLVDVEYCTTATLTIEECPTATASGGAANVTNSAGVVETTTASPGAADVIAAAAATAVPMTTVTETCDACGKLGESTVTLTIPLAVATGGEDVTVTAIVAVQTVMPVPPGAGTNLTGSPNSNVTGGANLLPVEAGAMKVAAVFLSWGLTAWLGLFGLFLVV